MSANGDGAQPPAGGSEPLQGPEPKGDDKPRDGVSRLRIAGYALLVVAVLAALVPILGLAADAPTSPQRSSAESSQVARETTTRKTTTKPKPAKTTKKKSRKPRSSAPAADAGPVIDSESKRQADNEQTRRKLVVGGIALGLLLIVIWGRRVRSVKRKKMDAQSKGGK
jgi:cytoskeletal protein RodZ